MCKGTHQVTGDENCIEKWGTTLMFYLAYFAWSDFCNYVNFETQTLDL